MDSNLIWWGDSISSLVVPSIFHLHDGGYSLLGSIPSSVSISIAHNVLPIRSSRNCSVTNLQPYASSVNLGPTHPYLVSVTSKAQAIGLPMLSGAVSGVHPADMGTGFTVWATHLLLSCTCHTLVFVSNMHFPESSYEDPGCIWPHSREILFLESHAEVVGSLLATLLSFTIATSPIDHSSVTILLPSSLTTSPPSTSHWSSQFTLLPISFLIAWDSPPIVTECCPFIQVSFSFLLHNYSTFPAGVFLWSTNSFTVPFRLLYPVPFPSFFPVLSNHFPLKYSAPSFLVALSFNRRIRFLSCWWITRSCVVEW